MVFSKNPVDVVREKKFDSLEVADALRLAIIAELDAISLYLQLAKYVEDERVRRVFEDVANEEKTHFGEFLALLKAYDPALAGELKAGAGEVEKLTGIKSGDPPGDGGNRAGEAGGGGWVVKFVEGVRGAAASSRRFRRYLQTIYVGRDADAVGVEAAGAQGSLERAVIPLREVRLRFTISYRGLEEWLSRGGAFPGEEAAARFAYMEDAAVAEALLRGAGRTLEASSWERPGSATAEVARAVAELYRAYVPEPYVLFVSPGRYARLVVVEERTGVMELTRVKSLVREVAVIPQLEDGVALLLSASPAVVDIAVGVDTEVVHLGPDEAGHSFLLRETLAVRIKKPEGVVVLRG
ncbi:encapsulin [Pyrobaculum neutrophilum]|nr:family 1 encapsulin nanocompartment shell protein [Pyrobaculum neutrophilum]